MKVICLLNKIANGESIPLKIKYNGVIWYYDKDINDYDSDEWYLRDYLGRTALNEFINDEIKIIEEDKPIENILVNYQDGHSQEEINEYLRCEINELIDEVNKLKKEKENE